MSALLVVGSGGREHALAWKLAQSPRVSRRIAAPGNDGFSADWERWDCDLGAGAPEFERLAKLAKEAGVALAVIGPDNPLAEGIVDVFEKHGLVTFGPSRAAARIESSKAFAKDVMRAAGVPTAKFEVFTSVEDARRFLAAAEWRPGGGWVLKADGLALGKGVQVCVTLAEAEAALARLFAVSGSLLIEERLQGEELSWLAFADGRRCAPLEPARDYKRLRDRDDGPNTGGMGAFSPVPGVTGRLAERVRREVFEPTLAELARRGVPFRGVLYAGLMVDLKADRLWVIEFNARFGDPETQVLLPRMQGDLYDWCLACARGDLSGMPASVPFSAERAVVVVGAAKGYPDRPEKGEPIPGPVGRAAPRLAPGEVAHHFIAGAVAGPDGVLRTSGGRVLGAVGMGADFGTARKEAYRRLDEVAFRGMQFRTDIAASAAARDVAEGGRSA